jgi:RimJ/RimL family protein N-acetyltransferase
MRALETPRLRMRPPESQDLDAFVEIHEDPEVLRHLTTIGQTSGRAAGWRIIAMLLGHWQLRGYGQWTVIEKATNQIIGRVGPWHPEGWPGIELGWIIRRSHWNLGFATEAAKAARDHAFAMIDTPQLISMIHPDNGASIRVAEKLGAKLGRRDAFGGAAVLVYELARPEGIPAPQTAAAPVLQDAPASPTASRQLRVVPTLETPEDDEARPFRDLPTTISGKLVDRRGRPAPKYVVVIFATDGTHWTTDAGRVQHTRPESNGQYTVSGLPAGDYFVGAVTELEPDDLGDTAFLKMLAKSATRVTLDAGARRVLDLQIGAPV